MSKKKVDKKKESLIERKADIRRLKVARKQRQFYDAINADKVAKRRKSRGICATIENAFNGEFGGCGLSTKLKVLLGRVAQHSLYKHIDPHKDRRQAFLELLLAVEKTKLLDVNRHPSDHRNNNFRRNNYVDALFAISEWHWMWVNPPKGWKCASKNVDRQFGSLVRHLLSKYEIPSFMDSAWFEYDHDKNTSIHKEWFVNLSQGENIRKQSRLPIKLTKRMAHLFLESPNDLTISGALRYAQVLGLDGNDRCARGLLATRVGLFQGEVNEDFWATVIRFFIANPMLDTIHYGPIVDYILNQRAEQPNFCMKGRTVDTLLQRVEDWHVELGRQAKIKRTGDLNWSSCGIRGIDFLEGKNDEKQCVIKELLSTKELMAEGKSLRHCVGSYSGSCSSGANAIYSLSIGHPLATKKMVTIQIEVKSRTIIEARGQCNAMPMPFEYRAINKWCAAEGLSLSRYL